MVARFTQSGHSLLLGIHKRPEIGLIGRAPVDIPRMQVLLQAKHVALPFYSLQTRCLSHPIVLSRLSRPCELNDRFRLCRPRRYLLCAHQFAADSVRVDGGRLAHPKARARPVVKDSFQTVFGMFIRPHHEKSGIGKQNYPRICDRLARARILTHLTHLRLIYIFSSREPPLPASRGVSVPVFSSRRGERRLSRRKYIY